MKYQVWRHHSLIHEFDSFQSLKNWMLIHAAFDDYRERILPATEAGFWNDEFEPEQLQHSLKWISICVEYCSIKQIHD